MKIQEFVFKEFLFSTDPAKFNIQYIYSFLSEKSYWAKGIPIHLIQRSIENSLSIGVYHHDRQIGFARVVTDYATFGYLADVFVDEAYRGKGLSKKMLEFIFEFDELKILRRILLATRDAHALYTKYGFKPLEKPDRFMELHRPDIYKQLN